MSQINFDTWQNVALTKTYYGAQAWVNFNGTGVVAIRASKNVSSITDNATGDYTVNFTTAMADANYSIVQANARSAGALGAINDSAAAPTTTAVRIISQNLAGTLTDTPYVCVTVFAN
jgi:hypothetical protein